MSGDRYLIRHQHDLYFLTCTVVYWIDLFSRKEYKHVITDSLNYCVKEKGLQIYAWVLMTNHLHLLCRATAPHRLSDVLRDFKKFTSKAIIKRMNEINESRREWMLNQFAFEAKRVGRAKNYKIWKDDNHAIWMHDKEVWNTIAYIHDNPVKAEIVNKSREYCYSSAMDYNGEQGLVDVTVLS